jgi:cyclin H
VLGLEFLVSQSLRFQFKVHHAALATYGMFLDLQLDNEEALSDLEASYPKVAAIVTQARLGDFEFLYTPSQIALAAFFAVDPGTVSTWLFAKQPATFQLTADDLIVQIKELAAELERFAATSPVDLERVREVDKRLRYCRNPEKDPNSALCVPSNACRPCLSPV